MINKDKKPLGLYLHIPFCIKKCLYCDFISAPAANEAKKEYVEILSEELASEAVNYSEFEVDTLFAGGGTPSVLSGEDIAFLIHTVRQNYKISEDAEITVEANPGTLDTEKLKSYRECGVNRLSLGLQSADNRELQSLGRIHTFETFLDTYKMVRSAGFQNINVDLMSALPGQTLQSYKRTLEQVCGLHPEHISAYSLMIEEGTYFYEHRQELELPDEDEERIMYELTEKILRKSGYHRYEISNYALPGKECIHNKRYWKRHDYAGFGIGAASLVENVRWNRAGDMAGFLLEPLKKVDVQILSRQEQMEEFMFLGLRLTKGISKSAFVEYFGVPIEEVYGTVLREMTGKKLLEVTEAGRIRLTEKGIDFSNIVMAGFLF